MQPLSVNAELISALRPATIVFDADVVAELTCRVECADSDDREAVAAGIADALKHYIRDEFDYAADTSISFIV